MFSTGSGLLFNLDTRQCNLLGNMSEHNTLPHGPSRFIRSANVFSFFVTLNIRIGAQLCLRRMVVMALDDDDRTDGGNKKRDG